MENTTKKGTPAVLWVPSSYLAMGFALCFPFETGKKVVKVEITLEA